MSALFRSSSTKTPGRNRRISSARQRKDQHLLDVKVRSRKAAQQRNRKLLAWLSILVLIAGTAVGAWYGSREALRTFFWQNPDYNLTEIGFKTDGTLTREQALEGTGLSEGVNIFSVDIAEVRKGLLMLAQVEHAEVERVLPNKILIEVAERKPVAWVAAKRDEDPTTSTSSFLVDRKGVLIRPKNRLEEYLRLPVIYGVPVENFEPGEAVETPELKAALDLLRLTNDSPGRFQVRSVDVSKGYCMVVTDQRRAQIMFPLDHVDQQLERLNVLLDHIEPAREIQTINLLVQRNVPVTFMPPPEPAVDEAQPNAKPAAAVSPTASKNGSKIPVKKAELVNKKTETLKPVRKAIPVNSHSR